MSEQEQREMLDFLKAAIITTESIIMDRDIKKQAKTLELAIKQLIIKKGNREIE